MWSNLWRSTGMCLPVTCVCHVNLGVVSRIGCHLSCVMYVLLLYAVCVCGLVRVVCAFVRVSVYVSGLACLRFVMFRL